MKIRSSEDTKKKYRYNQRYERISTVTEKPDTKYFTLRHTRVTGRPNEELSVMKRYRINEKFCGTKPVK